MRLGIIGVAIDRLGVSGVTLRSNAHAVAAQDPPAMIEGLVGVAGSGNQHNQCGDGIAGHDFFLACCFNCFHAAGQSHRMYARWKLGRALEKIERGAGPGRGKKSSHDAKSFMAYTSALGLNKDAISRAQRIGTLPPRSRGPPAALDDFFPHGDRFQPVTSPCRFQEPAKATNAVVAAGRAQVHGEHRHRLICLPLCCIERHAA